MKTNIKNLIAENPSGLLEMQQSLSLDEYSTNYGFDLKNVHTIYRSKVRYHSEKNWFAFGEKPLDQLFNVQEESEGDLLVVFIVEVIKQNRVHCYLVLTDEAFRQILDDRKNQHVLQVHQMYTKFFTDHIALNKTIQSVS